MFNQLASEVFQAERFFIIILRFFLFFGFFFQKAPLRLLKDALSLRLTCEKNVGRDRNSRVGQKSTTGSFNRARKTLAVRSANGAGKKRRRELATSQNLATRFFLSSALGRFAERAPTFRAIASPATAPNSRRKHDVAAAITVADMGGSSSALATDFLPVAQQKGTRVGQKKNRLLHKQFRTVLHKLSSS